MLNTNDIVRCINIDWLEMFCIEDDLNYPHNVDYFTKQGFIVETREYGTRLYKEMFTLLDSDGIPFVEVRRNPCANDHPGTKSFIPHNAAHIRFCNRSCYLSRAAEIMQFFCEQYGFAIQRISRIDLCLDFERFDSGDYPKVFLDRYVKNRYTKINQSRIHAHGTDEWDGRRWNSISWGSPTSQVSTKFYCKSQELREAKDKPYIRQAWATCQLIDDMHTMTKRRNDGTIYKPDIWRIEFSIKSSVKGWFVMEYDADGHKHRQSIKHTLEMYITRSQMLEVFASLANHYFHFKKYERDKNKYHCEDKQLFNWNQIARFYDVIRPANSRPMNSEMERLRLRLEHLKLTTYNHEALIAIKQILKYIGERLLVDTAARFSDKEEMRQLRQIIAFRMNNDQSEDVQQTMRRVKDLFNEYPDAY